MKGKKYALSLNLAKLAHEKIVTKKGNQAIVIPLDANHLFAGEKGIYLNGTLFVNDEADTYGNIGSIKQNMQGGKKWEEMSETEREAHKAAQKALPYLGNIKEQAGQVKETGFEDVTIDEDSGDLPW